MTDLFPWRRMLAGAATLAILAPLPGHAALKEGDTAPAFTAQASKAGKAYTYALKYALRQGPVVVYFYPAAYTNGCNIQAHTFAEEYAKFEAAGASVVGVSLDSIERLNEFSADPLYCAGKVAVASDADGKIAQAYALGVRDAVPGRKNTRGDEIDHGLAERTTFVVRPDGRIAATIGGLSPVENVAQALAAVQHLAKTK